MKKILIADHDYAVRLLYQMELEDEGYSVTTTDDYMGLIDYAKYLRPDLILFDVSSGESKELEIYRKFRLTLRDMPIVLCSANDSVLQDLKSVAEDGSFVKTIDLTRLKSIIKTTFQKASRSGQPFIPGHGDQLSFESHETHFIHEDSLGIA